jgi:hypothetical protein
LQTQLQQVTKFLFSFFLCFIFFKGFAQAAADTAIIKKDSVAVPKKNILPTDTSAKIINAAADTSLIKKDSLQLQINDSVLLQKKISDAQSQVFLFRKVLQYNAWFNFLEKPQAHFIEEHKPDSEDGLFYLLVGIVLYFALIRVFFAKYLGYVISLFIRGSMRQQQIRDQLLQTPLPSLLLNILFIISGGLYVCFLLIYYKFVPGINFWLLYIDCAAFVAILYLFKFFILKTTGWIFNITNATDTYIFIVYMANKMLGVLLLPVLVIFAFSSQATREITVTVSYCMLAVLLFYRVIASYPAIRGEIKVSIFYFFLYLCAFEIAPLLLIYKVLLTYLEKAY